MESVLKELKRPLEVDGKTPEDIDMLISQIAEGQQITIKLNKVKAESKPVEHRTENVDTTISGNEMRVNHEYIIKVRQYMTKPATSDFDFHTKWNSDTPMPFRVMSGRVLKETRGMFYMDCHAVPLKIGICMRCGRALSHPVSRLYGIGPECGGHAHINPFNTEEELYAKLDEVTKNLEQIKWKGWVIKSSIEYSREV